MSVGEEVYNKPLRTTPWTNMGGCLQVLYVQPFETIKQDKLILKSYFDYVISLNVWQLLRSIHVLTFDKYKKQTFVILVNFLKQFITTEILNPFLPKHKSAVSFQLCENFKN